MHADSARCSEIQTSRRIDRYARIVADGIRYVGLTQDPFQPQDFSRNRKVSPGEMNSRKPSSSILPRTGPPLLDAVPLPERA